MPVTADEAEEWRDPARRAATRCKVYLAYTSNLVSSGVRETIRFLVQHKMVDVLVTSAGGIEEDLIKCLADTYVGDFEMDGRDLRRRGLNRIGNLLVPNDNYCKFEDWVVPILDACVDEQTTRVREERRRRTGRERREGRRGRGEGWGEGRRGEVRSRGCEGRRGMQGCRETTVTHPPCARSLFPYVGYVGHALDAVQAHPPPRLRDQPP